MVINQDTKQLLKRLGTKLGLGVFGFTAAFIAAHISEFHINPLVAAAIVALLDDLSNFANTRYDVAGRVASAVGIRR